MLPGLMRTAATPASIALSASEALKWMSAITGSGEPATIAGSASASGRPGTATRTISQPAASSLAIWPSVAATSLVSVRVIDCTATGAPPPMGTPPTVIRWVEAISAGGYRAAPPSSAVTRAISAATEAGSTARLRAAELVLERRRDGGVVRPAAERPPAAGDL